MMKKIRNILRTFHIVQNNNTNIEVFSNSFGSDVYKVVSFIKNLINANPTMTQSKKITPLMYAATNMDEVGFKSLMKGQDQSYIEEKIPFQNCTGISALTLAAASGNLAALRELFETGYYDDAHLKEAVFFATVFNQIEVISFFSTKKISLFHPCFFDNLTSLHAACICGHPHLVKFLLSTNPEDQFISMRTFLSNSNAYDLALAMGNKECALLLENTKGVLWDKKVIAHMNGDSQKLMELIKNDKTDNPLVGDFPRRHVCLLSESATAMFIDQKYKAIFEMLFKYLKECSVDVQIDALLNTLANLSTLDDKQKLAFSAEISNLNQCIHDRLKELEPEYGNIKKLSFVGLVTKDLFDVFKNILDHSHPQIIDLTFYSPDVYDPDSEGGVCTLNLWSSETAKFVSSILTKTELVECNLLTSTYNTPLRELLDLIIERNKLVQQAPFEVMKDKIYNAYVKKINEKINYIKLNTYIDNADCLKSITSILPKVYSLTQVAAFFIANDPNKHYVKSAAATEEANELIEMAKMPSLN